MVEWYRKNCITIIASHIFHACIKYVHLEYGSLALSHQKKLLKKNEIKFFIFSHEVGGSAISPGRGPLDLTSSPSGLVTKTFLNPKN
jgi:hypothetical protein